MMGQENHEIDLVAPDPLLHRFDLLPLETFYPLGFSVDILTNDSRILSAAKESWGGWKHRFDKPAIPIRIAVSGEDQRLPEPPVFRAYGHLLAIVSDAANFATCDVSKGFAFCWLGSRAAAERTWVRYYFIEAIAYAIITHLYLTAVHAACIAKNGRAVLLCAASGTGKSVLALACAKRGWTFLGDDVSSLIRERPDATVIGRPERIKLLPSAASLFPELAQERRRTDQNGCSFVELRTSDLGIATAEECLVDFVVFLRRPVSGPARLLPVDSTETFARLVAELPVFEKSVHEAQLRSLSVLAALPAVELQYDGLDDAVKMLDQLIEGVR
jgi:hypothetical protein